MILSSEALGRLAAKCREQALGLSYAPDRAAMLEMAARYEERALRIEQHQRDQNKTAPSGVMSAAEGASGTEQVAAGQSLP